MVSARICCGAYATALLVVTSLAVVAPSWEGYDGWRTSPLWRGLVLDVVATAVVYVFSFCWNNSSVYDPYWCVMPLWLLFYWKAEAPGGFWYYEPRETMVLVSVWAWAWRFFLLVPWEGWTEGLTREDWRYAALRESLGPAYWPFSLSSLHLTPTLLVFGALAPAARVVLLGSTAPDLNGLDAIALVAVGGSLAVETAADEQLRRHRARQGPATTCVSGLWSRSRHPNYFGECAFWASLSLFGVAAGVLDLALALGPAALFLFFRLASVPLMDQRNLERRPDYAAATKGIPALVPSPFKFNLKHARRHRAD